MCSIGLALGLASSAIGAVGQIQQGKAAADAANYNAKVGTMNAELADRRARDAVARGQVEEQQKRQQVGQIEGRQRAAYAASGVDVAFGSPLDVMVDTATQGELDALTVRSNSYRESYDQQIGGWNARTGAQLDRQEAKADTTGSFLSAAGTLLGGASKAFGSYAAPRTGSYASPLAPA